MLKIWFWFHQILISHCRNSLTNIACRFLLLRRMQQCSDDHLLAHNPPFFFLEPADKRLGSDKAEKGSNNIAGL